MKQTSKQKTPSFCPAAKGVAEADKRQILEIVENALLPLVRRGGAHVLTTCAALGGSHGHVPATVCAAPPETAPAPARTAPGGELLIELQTHPETHHDWSEWVWLLSGRAHMEIDGDIYPLKPGDFCFLPSRVSHRDLFNRETEAYTSIWFTHRPGLLGINLFHYTPLGRWHVVSSTVAATPELNQIVGSLHREFTSASPYRQEAVTGLLLQLVVCLARAVAAEVTLPTGVDSHTVIAAKVVRFFREHYMENIGVEDVARELHFNPNYLASLFKQETGRTLFQTLTEIRMNHAARLLLDLHMPVKTVAQTVGYGGVAQFSRAFRRSTGMLPSHYMRGAGSESPGHASSK